MAETLDPVGIGVYTVSEAARLTRVPALRIRRWLSGYTYFVRDEVRLSRPVWTRQLPVVEGALALGFRDLIEVRLVDAFRSAGVGWKALRLAAERAAELFGDSHPFSVKRFKTDGLTIFAEVGKETCELQLLDLAKSQYAFKRILDPYLRDLEFSDELTAVRWWPLGFHRRVVIDPKRQFGAPIVVREGVPTAIIASAVAQEESIEKVAAWFEVERRAVRDAVEFEERLAA